MGLVINEKNVLDCRRRFIIGVLYYLVQIINILSILVVYGGEYSVRKQFHCISISLWT